MQKNEHGEARRGIHDWPALARRPNRTAAFSRHRSPFLFWDSTCIPSPGLMTDGSISQRHTYSFVQDTVELSEYPLCFSLLYDSFAPTSTYAQGPSPMSSHGNPRHYFADRLKSLNALLGRDAGALRWTETTGNDLPPTDWRRSKSSGVLGKIASRLLVVRSTGCQHTASARRSELALVSSRVET